MCGGIRKCAEIVRNLCGGAPAQFAHNIGVGLPRMCVHKFRAFFRQNMSFSLRPSCTGKKCLNPRARSPKSWILKSSLVSTKGPGVFWPSTGVKEADLWKNPRKSLRRDSKGLPFPKKFEKGVEYDIYIYTHIYIYIYGVRPICRLHFSQNFHFAQFYSKNWPPKWTWKRVNFTHFWGGVISVFVSSFLTPNSTLKQ